MALTLNLVILAAIACSVATVAADPVLYSKLDTLAPVNDNINYRLPPNLIPISYTVELTPYLEGNFGFDGHVTIMFRVEDETNNITLHKNMIDVDVSTIIIDPMNNVDEIEISVMDTVEDLVRHFFTITVNDTLQRNQRYLLSMYFTGKLHDDMQGFYRSSYEAENGEKRWLATTQFQAVHARRAFPCFDEPALRAKFTIKICRPKNMTAISNMPLDVTEPDLELGVPNGRWCDTFRETPDMPTYLVAFIVSNFSYLSDENAHLRIFAQPSMIQQANYSLQVSPPILDWLANYTEIAYMLPKMDEAAIPDFDAGAMENWGLATYRERLLLLEEGVSTSESKQRIATVIAHEYAHQWFGDYVTPDWWSYAWLNEGFATYFESFATANVETTWRLEEQFVVREVQDAMAVDALETSHAMTHDVCSPSSINAIFDNIIYAKAGSVIRMMKHMVTPETFRLGLKNYLNARSYRTATPDHLYKYLHSRLIIDNPSGENVFDLPTVMKTWSDQMGYPVIHVKRNYQRFKAEVTQERFLLKKTANNPDPHIYKWYIPLTYTTQNESDFESTTTKLWLNLEQTMVSISYLPAMANEWILFNIQETGYYRVNYDAPNWQLLTEYLDSDSYTKIHLLNRAQLIDDSFNLARAGHINYSIPFDLSRFLKREVDYVPWYSAFNAFSYLIGKLSNNQDFVHMQTYLIQLISTLYEDVGFTEGDSDDHVLKLNRAAAVNWACSLGHENCSKQAVDLFKQWMTSVSLANIIKPDLRSGVYCTALRKGDTNEWDFLWNQYTSASVSSEKTLIISSLGCTQNTTILGGYLESSIAENSPIRRQDSRAVFTAVYYNNVGVDIALDFLIKNFKEMATFYGGLNSLGSMLSGIANRINTEEQARKLKEFLATNEEELADAGTAVQNAINIVDETLEWQRQNAQIILDWVKDEVGVEESPTTSTGTSTSSSSSVTFTSTTAPTSTTKPGSASMASLSSVIFALVICVYIIL